ncbi:MAG: hypothetical protein LUD77_09820 [Clostridiales bacterium]|nr:hypothetical protein [Clostridiales bacterium]
MILREKTAGLKRYIADDDGLIIYRIKYKGLLERGKCICDLKGRVIYDIAENTGGFVVRNHLGSSEMFVKTGEKIKTQGEPFKLSFYGEFYIPEKDICVKYRSTGIYDIFIKGKKTGVINKGTIVSETVCDRGLLAGLYVFSEYILNDKRMNTAARLVNISA